MPNPHIRTPKPPAFLDQVPRAVVRALDIQQVMATALTCMGSQAWVGVVVALHEIDSYCGAARRQQRRIATAEGSIRRWILRRAGAPPLRTLFSDAHFYLISWARVAKLARFVSQSTRSTRVRLVLRKYHRDLEDRIDARNHLEHLEERFPGGQKHSKLAIPNDLLNMSAKYLTYGGGRLDIGPDSLRLLRSFRDEFLEALLYDSLETVANNDQRKFSVLLAMAAQRVHVARATRKVREMLEGRTQQSG